MYDWNAYRDGCAAADVLICMTENPHKHGTSAWSAWKEGFCDRRQGKTRP